MDTGDLSQSKSMSEFSFITKSELSRLIPDFPRNKNGEINSNCAEFRKLHQEINCSRFPINNDGTPDMRHTTREDIVRLKLAQIQKKN